MMSRMNTLALGLAALAIGAHAATAQGMAPADTAKMHKVAKVHIVSPAAGSVVAGTSVHVVLEAQGIEIAPAALHKPGTAHHHLFLDTDLTPAGQAIPAGVAGIWHLGKGQTEFTLDSLKAGQHRLIDLLADPDHVPLSPAVADTVKFTVKP